MTSGRLFLSILKADFRQRAWIFLLGFIVFFLELPVSYLLMMGNGAGAEPLRALETAQELISLQGHFLMTVTIAAAACVCAPSGFAYLFRRPGTDYYHSLPVRREILFAARYVDGVLICLLPLGINLLILLALSASSGAALSALLKGAVFSFAVNSAAYLLLYSVSLTAVFLTGSLGVSVLMTAFLYLYGYWIRCLRISMMDTFFRTYYMDGMLGNDSTVCSPLSYMSLMSRGGVFLAGGLLLAAGFGALALLLYRLRPSEASDRALAFPVMRLPFKFLLCVPAGISGGLFFYSMRDGIVWFLFGMTVFWMIAAIFTEMLTALSFRQGFAHKKSSGVCLAACGVILLVFAQDLTGYDRYLPAKESLAYMAVNVSGLDTGQDVYVWGEEGVPVYESSSYYRMNHMRLTDLDAAYGLAEESVRAAERTSGQRDMVICFTTKGGRTIRRQYPLRSEEQMNLLAQVYRSEEYKEGCFPILTDREHLGYYAGIRYRDFLGQEYEQMLTQPELERIYEAYTQDLMDTALEDVLTQEAGTLSFRIRVDRGPAYGGIYERDQGSYPVYMDYRRTLAVLEELGISAIGDPSAIVRMEVDDYREYGDYVDIETRTYVDPDTIRALLPSLRIRSNSWYNRIDDSAYADQLEVRLYLEGQGEETGSYNTYNPYKIWLADTPESFRREMGL